MKVSAIPTILGIVIICALFTVCRWFGLIYLNFNSFELDLPSQQVFVVVPTLDSPKNDNETVGHGGDTSIKYNKEYMKNDPYLIHSVNNKTYTVDIWRFNASMHLYVSVIVLATNKERYSNAIKLCQNVGKYDVTCELFHAYDTSIFNNDRLSLCQKFSNIIEYRWCFDAPSAAKIGSVISKHRLYTYALSNIFSNKDYKFNFDRKYLMSPSDHESTANYSFNDDYNSNDQNSSNFKYLLLLEGDALLNDNFVQVLNYETNQLIRYRITQLILHYFNKIKFSQKNGLNSAKSMNITNDLNISNIFFTEEQVSIILNDLSLNTFWMIESLFDIFQFYPPGWCFKKEEYLQQKLNTKSQNIYYYSKPMIFSRTTALMFNSYALKTVLNSLNYYYYCNPSDKILSKLLYDTRLAKPRLLRAFATCPAIAGEIGGHSTLLNNTRHTRPVGWQRTTKKKKKKKTKKVKI